MRRSSLIQAGLPADGTITRLPGATCPICRSLIDATSSTRCQHLPKPGDLALCGDCGALLKFDMDLQHPVATQQDLDGLSETEKQDVYNAQRIVAEARKG